MATATMPRWQVWLVASRPRTFPASITPILAGSLLAWRDGDINLPLLPLMLVASILTHAATNFTNDYFDDHRGVDKVQRLGPGGMLQAGYLSRADLRHAMLVTFGLALVSGLPVVLSAGWPVFMIALFSAAIAYFYTAGPVPFAYIRLGEIVVFLAMGIAMVCGSYYVHTGTVSGVALAIASGFGMHTAAIMHANNIRDTRPDRAHGKITLANSLGRHRADLMYAGLVLVPSLITIGIVIARPSLWPLLVALIAAPIALGVTRQLRASEGDEVLNLIVKRTAQLQMTYGLLVNLGLALAGIAAW